MFGLIAWERAWKLHHELKAAGADAIGLWANGVGPEIPLAPLPRAELEARLVERPVVREGIARFATARALPPVERMRRGVLYPEVIT